MFSGINEELQLNSLYAMQELLSYMFFMGGKNGGLCRKPFQSGIIASIKSVIGLYFELKSEGVLYFLTTKVNQDIVESLFSNIRGIGGGNSHPTPVDTISRIRKLCVSKNVDSVLDNSNVKQSDKEMKKNHCFIDKSYRWLALFVIISSGTHSQTTATAKTGSITDLLFMLYDPETLRKTLKSASTDIRTLSSLAFVPVGHWPWQYFFFSVLLNF